MMQLTFERDGWLNSSPDDEEEARALTRLRIRLHDASITKNYSKRGGGESDAINVSLLPLATFIASAWWQLLYEPLRPGLSRAFQARHRLDAGMRGYAFPALAIFSAGEDAIAVDWAPIENPYSPVSFVSPSPVEPIQVDRSNTEITLMDLVQSVLERLSPKGIDRTILRDIWAPVEHSISEPEEYQYCVTAGRLGLNPYDPDTPNLEAYANGLSDELFADVSEAAELDELDSATDWLRQASGRFALFPEVSLRQFGSPPSDDINEPAWLTGEASATGVRTNTGLRYEHPRKAVEELFGPAVTRRREFAERGPETVTAVLERSDGVARILPVAKSARQRRFRACSAAYLAWTAKPGEQRAATVALTRRQQASRAFAAELLAPKEVLIERAGYYGFNSDDIEEIASEFVCPFDTVLFQALHAGIPLRGIQLPSTQRPRVTRGT